MELDMKSYCPTAKISTPIQHRTGSPSRSNQARGEIECIQIGKWHGLFLMMIWSYIYKVFKIPPKDIELQSLECRTNKFQDAKSAHSLTHGIVAHQVLLHLRLVPTVHGFQGAEQGPPPWLDLGGTHFNQLPDGRDNLQRQRGWPLVPFPSKKQVSFWEDGCASRLPISGLILVQEKKSKPRQTHSKVF